jgi:hypothetical protein
MQVQGSIASYRLTNLGLPRKIRQCIELVMISQLPDTLNSLTCDFERLLVILLDGAILH